VGARPAYGHPVDLTGGVAARVASLCLGANGKLSVMLLCGTAVRGGLLLDLALAGRVESAEDSVVVDPAPTGFGPADRLLAAIAVEPERSLDGWLDERRIGLRDVADANVASGRWARRPGPFGFGRRYADLQAAQTERDRGRSADDDTQPWSRVDACVTALATAAGLQDLEVWAPGRRRDDLLPETGPVAWLAAAVVDHVLVTGARYRAQAGAMGAGTVGPF
jgi:Golgi phosphoprotein 3 GPP34